jgi:hypothetical protein
VRQLLDLQISELAPVIRRERGRKNVLMQDLTPRLWFRYDEGQFELCAKQVLEALLRAEEWWSHHA